MVGRDSSGGGPAKTLTLPEPELSPTADTLVAPSPAAAPLQPGERIGRYVVLSLLGAGGMGAVYAAYDPELDRRIALKVLAAEPSHAPADAHARLLREAQALARLSHPNVLPVHDVGVVADRVFIAMELVEGDTLAAWMAQPRRLAEILAVFRAAGLGLAAAHAAGIVHRDFKPHNVLVGADGRVRVADFGLARPPDDGTAEPDDVSSPTPAIASPTRPPRFHAAITRTGAVLGTPAYMAPEQLRCEPTDARADQYAFCVALHEALHGERPFAPPGRAALAAATTAELRKSPAPARGAGDDDATEPRAPRPARRVPGWLADAVRRGLSADPDDRFPSMEALLAALDRDPATRRLRVAVAAAALVVVAGAAIAWRTTRTAPCGGAARHLAGVWDAPARAAAGAGLRATATPFADEAARAVTARLDDYAAEWTAMNVDSCRATRVHGDQSEAVLDLRMACLRERLDALRELARLLAAADRTVALNAAAAAAALPPISDCRDIERLRTPVPLPAEPQRRAAVERVRADLAAVRAQLTAGRWADALAAAGPAVEAARATGYLPVVAEAQLALGLCQRQAARPEEAAKSLVAAGFTAEASRHDEVRAAAWTHLAELEAKWRSDLAQAHRWAELAELTVRRLGDPPLARARLLEVVADILGVEGSWAEALAPLREALALYERAGADDSVLASVRLATAEALENLAHYEESRDEADRAVALIEAELGPRHPLLAAPLDAGGVARWRLGQLAEAEAYHRRALALREEWLSPDHPDLAVTLLNLSHVLVDGDRAAEAIPLLERALAIEEKTLGPRHVNVATTLTALATASRELDRLPVARAYLERALSIREERLGPEHPEVAGLLDNLGNVAFDEERYDEAIAYQERALAIAEKTFGPEHPRVALIVAHLAGDYLEVGRLDAASAAGERALALLEGALGPEHTDLAGPLHTLGRVRRRQRRPAEAIGHAERAVAILDRAGLGDTTNAAIALGGLGAAYLEDGRRGEAIAALERAAAIAPYDEETQTLLAKARGGR